MTKKKKSEERGFEPYVMTPEEALAFLDRKGIKYEICDTPVPVLGNKVNCGVPLDSGEQMIEEYYYLPKSVVGLNPVVDIPTQGDSMIEADIHEGDLEYLKRSQKAAAYCAEKLGWKTVECVRDGQMRSIEDIHSEIMTLIK